MRNTLALAVPAALALLAAACSPAAAPKDKPPEAVKAVAPGEPPCTENTAACLKTVGDMYLAALLSHDGSKLPLAPNVRRTEQGPTNAKGDHEVRESFVRTNMVKAVRDVKYWTNLDTQEITYFFATDIDLGEADVSPNGATKAGDSHYKTAVHVPPGTYTVHEAERFKIDKGYITEIEIIAYVETGKGQGAGWPVERDAAVKKADDAKK